jgi:hypothetical protein
MKISIAVRQAGPVQISAQVGHENGKGCKTKSLSG